MSNLQIIYQIKLGEINKSTQHTSNDEILLESTNLNTILSNFRNKVDLIANNTFGGKGCIKHSVCDFFNFYMCDKNKNLKEYRLYIDFKNLEDIIEHYKTPNLLKALRHNFILFEK